MSTYRIEGVKYNPANWAGLDPSERAACNRFAAARERELNTIKTTQWSCNGGPFNGHPVELESTTAGTAPINVGAWAGRYELQTDPEHIKNHGRPFAPGDAPQLLVWVGTNGGQAINTHQHTTDQKKAVDGATGRGFDQLRDLLAELGEDPAERATSSPIGLRAKYTIGSTTYTIAATEEACDRLRARILKARRWFSDKLLNTSAPALSETPTAGAADQANSSEAPAPAEAPAAAAVAASLAIGSAQASSAAAPATEAPAPAPAPAAYTLPANTYTEWDGCEREDYKPSDRQKIIAAAVARAIASGLFYTRDVLDFVCADLQPSEETKAAGINRVEGGDIGMDAYYARRYIEAQAQHTAQREAAQAMALQPGDKIGTVRTSDLKRITGMTVTSVSNDGAAIELTGKRGSAAVVWKTTPMGLKIAIDRAAEKGQRKDGFEAFTAARKTKPQKAAPAPAPAEAPAAAAVAASFAIGAAQASSAATPATEAPAAEAGELAEVCADTPQAEAEAVAQAHTPQASSAADYTGPLKTLAQAGDYTPALKTHRLRSEFFAASNVQNSAAKSGAWRAAMFLTSTCAPALRFTGPDGVDHYAEHASGPERMRALQAMAQAAESEAREAAASAPAPSKKHRAAAEHALRASTQAEHLADAEKLEAANDHSTALYCRCLAAGFADLAAKLLPLIETQDKAGHLTDAIGQQRAAIAAELKARQQASAAHTPQASGAAPAGYTAPLKTQAADCTEQHETPAALAPFERTQPVKIDLRTLIKGGMKIADLVGLGVNYGGDMANAAGTGAIVSAEACDFYGLKVGIMLEDGRAWRTEPHSFSDSPGSRLALNWKNHGAPYLAQLSAAVAASKASKSSAQELQRQEHARQLETLAAEFAHLQRKGPSDHGGTFAARNIRTMLKAAFPGVKFSVKSDYSSVNVRWTDGPTNTQVNAVIDRFDIGRADHQSDYFYTESSAWSDLFGGVQYLFTDREESPELVAQAMAEFNSRTGHKATAEDWKKQTGLFCFNQRDAQSNRQWFRETLNKTEGAPAAKQRAAAQK